MTVHRRPLRPILAALLAVSTVLAACSSTGGGPSAPLGTPTGTDGGSATSAPSGGALRPPDVTPLAEPPAAPAGDGTRAVIATELGDIVIELFTESAPVASANFISLAGADFYDGVGFHRVIPGFVIQGGDPEGTGSGGPGYSIPDDPVVGEYERGIVAMARPAGPGGQLIPDSQGSQFFVILDDLRGRLPKEGGYSIFGRVVEGMDVVDRIAAADTSGPPQDRPLDPVEMADVTIEPGAGG
jgi:cyclophilin family peptidyl-prolyl cis-trans isomerase